MVHGVRLRDGRAEWYRNRWVRSQAVAEARGETWPAGRCTTAWTSRPTRTSSPTPGAPWPRWSPARCRTSSPVSWTPSARATSAGRCPAASPRTPSSTATGELHAIAYFWAWDHVQHVVVGAGGTVTPHHQHPGRRRPDDARLRAHRPLRGAVRPAGHVQHGRGLGRAEAALHLEPRAPGPGRPAAPRRTPQPTSAGSRSTRAGSSTPSTPTTTAAGSSSTCPVRGRLRRLHAGRARAADAGPLDHRPGRRESHPAAPGRPPAGVPPHRRTGHRPAAPLRLQRRHRRGRPRHGLTWRRLRRRGVRQRAAQTRPGRGHRRRRTSSATTPPRAKRSSPLPHPAPPRTTAT